MQQLKGINQLSRKKGEKSHKVLLTQTKLNIIEVFISKSLRDSYINHEEFVSVNNLLREYMT